MEPKPDFNRFVKAAKHREADRVPMCEAVIGYGIQSRFLGKEVAPDDLKSQIEFWTKAGYDFVPISVSLMNPGKVTEESGITKLLKKMVLEKDPGETDPKAWNLELSSFIHEREDFDRFPWDAASDLDFSALERAGELIPDGMKVIAISGKIFTLSWMLMGFQNFSLKLMLETDLVTDVFRKVAEIQFSALEKILKKNYVGGVWVVDDVAFGTGPMLSPEHLREHVFSWYKKMADRCHQEDRLFLMHSDGDLSTLMEDIIDTGVDVLHPIDPHCMDIFETKRRYGDRICLVGNVSNEMLRSGSVEEVKAYTKELIRKCAPGGGYMVSAGNSVPDWAQI